MEDAAVNRPEKSITQLTLCQVTDEVSETQKLPAYATHSQDLKS